MNKLLWKGLKQDNDKYPNKVFITCYLIAGAHD